MNINAATIILIIGNVVASQSSNLFADNLLHKLKQENWKKDEQPCLKAMKRLIEGAKNNSVSSIWVLDSMQQPVGALYGSRYHLGNFDQCLDDTWSSTHPELETQYCLVDLTDVEVPTDQFEPYDDVECFIKSKTKYGKKLYLNSFGVCLPSSCSAHLVERISKHIISSSHLRYGDVSVEPQNCQTMKQTLDYSTGFYLFWTIIVCLTFIILVVYLFEDDINHSQWSGLVIIFSPSKNFKALTKINSDEVKHLNGIRAISNGFTIVMHYLYFINVLTVINHTNVGKDLETGVGKILAHLDVLIDSFFVLSGFLLVRGLCANKSVNFWSTIYKRYRRFISPYAMILLYLISVSPHTGSGPLWPKYLKEQQEPCIRNWWTGLIMMGNFINTKDMCYVVTWYLSCDFQLAILGVIAFIFWKQSKRNRIILFTIGLVLFIAIPSFLSFYYRLTHILFYDLDDAFNISLNDTCQISYFKFYNRASSYLIGYATGYIMAVYKQKPNEKLFSKSFSITCSLLIACIVGNMLYATGSLMFKQYDGIRFAICAGFDRVIWSVGVCGLIVICEYGTLPIVTDLLSSKVFVPLSRLSYGAYLIHMAIIYRNVYSLRAPITYDFFHLVIHGLGYIVIALLLSYVQWFIIEAPSANLFNHLQKRHENIEKDSQHSLKNGKHK